MSMLTRVLLVVLVDGEAGAAGGNGGRDLLLDPVRPCVLGILLRLMLLMLHSLYY
jgi:hypothetical protein